MHCVHQEAEPSKYGTRSEVGVRGQEGGDVGADGDDEDGDRDGADCGEVKGR